MIQEIEKNDENESGMEDIIITKKIQVILNNKVKNMVQEKIWYAGEEVIFRYEVDSIDEAQAWLDYYKKQGKESCCLHEHGKHQVYSN